MEDKVKELQQQVGGLQEQLALKEQQLDVLHDLSMAEDEAQRRQLVAADAKQHTLNTAMAHMIQSLHRVCGAEQCNYATSRLGLLAVSFSCLRKSVKWNAERRLPLL